MSTDNENYVEITSSRCKGCGVCVQTCPKECLVLGSEINKLGYQYARFEQNGCVACGMCFYSCPEFGAIKVYKKDKIGKDTEK